MPKLRIIQKGSKFALRLPHKVWINSQCVGIMQTPSADIELPEGVYIVTIQSMIPLLRASAQVHIREGCTQVLEFRDREKWWDALFVVDMVLWTVDFFLTLPHPWGLIYKIFTNGYFALWLLYEWLIRNKYFHIETYRITTHQGENTR